MAQHARRIGETAHRMNVTFEASLPHRSADAARPRTAHSAPPLPTASTTTPARPWSCPCGGSCPRCSGKAPAVSLRAELQPASLHEEGDPDEAVAQQDEAQTLGNSACPVNAVFLSNAAGGNSKVNCQVPSGQFGAARLAQYRVAGLAPIPPGGVTIGEQFAAIEDPYKVAGKLTPNQMRTDANGMFDDCYSLYSPNPLPSDFILKVEQNHLYQAQVISRNIVTYRTDQNVDVRHCRRVANSCEFSKRCSL